MAQRHPGTRRSQQSEPDDVFVAKVLEAGKWAESHQQLLTVLGVVALIGIGALLYLRNYRANMNVQAATELEQIYQSVSIQDLEGARGELVTFLDRFGGSAYEPEARLLLGDLYLRDDSPEQALAVLRPLGESPRRPIDFQAAALLAAALEEDRQWDEAERVYLLIANRSDLDFQVRDALEAAARIRKDRGDGDGAVELYRRVIDLLEDGDPQRGLYEMRITEIETAASA